jgi:hypothetical protein
MLSFKQFYNKFITNIELKKNILNINIKEFRYDDIDYICLDDIKKLIYLLYKIKNDHISDINMIYVHKYIFYILRMYPLNYYNNQNQKSKFISHNNNSYLLIKCNESFGICINNNKSISYYIDRLVYYKYKNHEIPDYTDNLNFTLFFNILKTLPIKIIKKHNNLIHKIKFFNLFNNYDGIKNDRWVIDCIDYNNLENSYLSKKSIEI